MFSISTEHIFCTKCHARPGGTCPRGVHSPGRETARTYRSSRAPARPTAQKRGHGNRVRSAGRCQTKWGGRGVPGRVRGHQLGCLMPPASGSSYCSQPHCPGEPLPPRRVLGRWGRWAGGRGKAYLSARGPGPVEAGGPQGLSDDLLPGAQLLQPLARAMSFPTCPWEPGEPPVVLTPLLSRCFSRITHSDLPNSPSPASRLLVCLLVDFDLGFYHNSNSPPRCGSVWGPDPSSLHLPRPVCIIGPED